MPQNKIIDAIDVEDAFLDLHQTSHLLDAIQSKLSLSNGDKKTFESVSYLFHLYLDEHRRLMTNLAEIIDVKI